MIPIEKQAKAVLWAKEWDLAQEYCDGDIEQLRSLLTVSREDLKQYIANNGFPEGWWRFEAATFDGLYTIEQAGAWIVYFQERGSIDYQFPETFDTKSLAVDFVLDNVYLKWK